MKNPRPRDEESQGKGSEIAAAVSGKKKNMKRLGGGRGGGGLSLAAFANMKSNKNYNPGLIKKQKEFYKNAKYINKYKKSLKKTTQHNESSSAVNSKDKESDLGKSSKTYNNKRNPSSLQILYEKKREEEERARAEREAIIQAKKEEREKAGARRKAQREKMFKKTRSGQPVMKYRIEHLLQTIQNSI